MRHVATDEALACGFNAPIPMGINAGLMPRLPGRTVDESGDLLAFTVGKSRFIAINEGRQEVLRDIERNRNVFCHDHAPKSVELRGGR